MKWGQGKVSEAVTHLQAGFKIASERKFYHFLYLSRKDIVRLCILALEQEIPGGQVLRRPPPHNPAGGPGQGWSWRSLSTIPTKGWPNGPGRSGGPFTGPERSGCASRPWEASACGGVRPRWQRAILKAAGPQLLLKAVLAHGAQGVVKDVLLEDLWPEADPEGAEKNFKVNLHRLRQGP